MKKVVIIAEAMLGGIRQHVFDIVRGLDKSTYEIYLIYSESRADEKFYEEIEAIEKEVYLIKCNEMQREISVQDLVAYKKIKKILNEIRPDIVHCHSSKAGIVGRLAAWYCKVPMVIYTPNAYAFQSPDVMGIKKYMYILIERFLSRFCSNYTINVSEGEMNVALRYHIDKKSKFLLMYNGISSVSLMSKTEARSKLRLEPDRKYVGFTGRCARQKDPNSFFEIAKKVIEERGDVDFVYVGDGEMENEMREWIRCNNLTDRIFMLGFRNDASLIVSAFDVYLSTALYEGLPYSMIEAMRAGIPIVATNCIGNNELVLDGETGYLFETGEIDEACRLILECLEKNIIDSTKVRKVFERKFSVENMVKTLEQLYGSII